ncbi:type II toxin-antitoxin system VapB family antitoxin [Sphingomonas baiyangensis]|uniref:Type II toxin-antitoxin system VapB family antitoxin n=1 Tax=Sphingomonas baiyangensis TaxID=2572576 RepID=A0A4U1L5R1_9SPHN|nr:type II toxin-antitoxin system VapB family antitoxin [Sphingomonas baiyangensis]TKD51643.1 type II toxin-antitoxin system VapB family antitoxin [Sphingomonas baiyangensis]
MRTNIVIDDELMAQAMAIGDAATKREAVDKALRVYVRLGRQRELLALFGTVPDWEGDLDAMRSGS